MHRISNRWGYIRTRSPAESEQVLRDKLPKVYWIAYNDLLVPFGQNICTPISPRCSECKLSRYAISLKLPTCLASSNISEILGTFFSVMIRATSSACIS